MWTNNGTYQQNLDAANHNFDESPGETQNVHPRALQNGNDRQVDVDMKLTEEKTHKDGDGQFETSKKDSTRWCGCKKNRLACECLFL